jgi:Icc protein
MRRIAFLTDVHLDEQFPIDNDVDPYENLRITLNDLSKRNITEIVVGGDIGEASSHEYFFDVLNQFSFKVILGNHDKFDEVKKHFSRDADKPELYYKEEDDNCLYIFLDTSSDEISENQLNWLKSELNNGKAVVLFVHHPVLAINTPVDILYPLKSRERLKSILLEHNNSVTIFCGHYHMNDEQEEDNVKQIITQSLSYQLEKDAPEIKILNSDFGYRIIEVNENKVEHRLIQFQS